MQLINQRFVGHATVIAAALALAACGGDPAVVERVSPVEYTLAGTAVKGPLNKAEVSVYKLGADGKRGEKLGTGTSVAGGGYSIQYQDYTGPVLVEVVATAETEMFDEATGTIVKPVGLVLKAAFQPAIVGDARSFKVQVNPLTTNAVEAAARMAGGLTKANIEQANKDLIESVGFDPLTDAPEFDESNKPKNQAAVVMAAISQLAKDNDVEACKDEADAAAKVRCVVGELGKSALGELKFPTLQSKIDEVAASVNLEPPKLTPPTNTPPSGDTAIAQAKALMATLRSNAKALDASDLSLQKELTSLSSEIDQGVAPVVDSTFEMLRTLDFGVELLESAQKGSGIYSGNRWGAPYAAGCTVYTDATDANGNYTFRTIATSDETAKIVGCSSYTGINNNVLDVNVTGVVNTWRWRHRLLVSPKADAQGTYVVKTTARREYGSCQYSTGYCGMFTQTYVGTPNQAKPMPVESFLSYSVQRGEEGVAEFTRTFTGDNLTALKLTGSTAPSLVYGGGLAVSPVLDNGRGRRHEVDLDVAKIDADGRQKLVLNRDAVIRFFSSNEQGQTIFMSSIGVGKDSFMEGPANLEARDGTEKFDLRIGYVAGNSAIRGQFAASDAKWDKSKTQYSPTKLTFGGRLERRTDASSPWVDFLRGNLSIELVDFANYSSLQPNSDNNPRKVKATLNAAVTIPTRPMLTVQDLVINATGKGDAGDIVTMSGQYRQGSAVINLAGNNGSAANGNQAVLTLTSSEGIKFVYDGAKTVHPMSKGDVAVGEYNKATGRLTYRDNSFEQF